MWRSISRASARRYTLYIIQGHQHWRTWCTDKFLQRFRNCFDQPYWVYVSTQMAEIIIYYWPANCTRIMHVDTRIVCCDTYSFFFSKIPARRERVYLRLKYVWFSGYPTHTSYHPLPFKHFKGFPSSAICPSRVRHGGHFYHSIYIILFVCSFLEHCSDPSMKSTCAEPHMSSVLMTDVISADSGEHVCLHNLVRVSFTNKV